MTGARVPLEEPILGLQLGERLLCNVVVVDAILLAGAGPAGRVRYGERKGVGVSLSTSQEPRSWTSRNGRTWNSRARNDDGAGIANCAGISLNVFPRRRL
jgi:hypothetical protein